MRAFIRAWSRSGWSWGEWEAGVLGLVFFTMAAIAYPVDHGEGIGFAYISAGLLGLATLLGVVTALRRMRR